MLRRLFRKPDVIVLAGTALVVLGAVSRAQDPGHGYTTADIERGGQTFLLSCASCHGPNGDTVPGVSLATGAFRRANTDQELATIMRRGIPGTAMPPSGLSETDALQVVAYLRSLPAAIAASKTTSALPGTAAVGQALYGSMECAKCHMIDGVGGYLGPDLSSAGITRTADELLRALTQPSVDIRVGSRTVTVATGNGPPTVGRLMNHDTYSLQFIDTSGRLTSVRKDAVRSWEIMEASAMPSYAGLLSPQQIADVVAYLQALNAPVRTGGVAGTPRGGGRGGAAPPAAGRGGVAAPPAGARGGPGAP